MPDRDISLKDFLNASDIIKNADKIDACMATGRSLQKCLNVPDEKIESIYEFAHQLMQDKSYKDAANILAYLLVVNSFDSRFWKSLGICRSLEGDQLGAADCFSVAILLEPRNAENYLWTALVFSQLGEFCTAANILRYAQTTELGAVGDIVEEALKAMDDSDEEAAQGLYHRQFRVRLETLALELQDKILEREERQRVVHVQVVHGAGQELPGGFPRSMTAFRKTLKDDFDGNLVAFCMSFLSEGKGGGVQQQRDFN